MPNKQGLTIWNMYAQGSQRRDPQVKSRPTCTLGNQVAEKKTVRTMQANVKENTKPKARTKKKDYKIKE